MRLSLKIIDSSCMYHVNDYGYDSNKSKNVEQFHNDMAATSVHSKLMTIWCKKCSVANFSSCQIAFIDILYKYIRSSGNDLFTIEGETIFTVFCDLSLSLDQLIVLRV